MKAKMYQSHNGLIYRANGDEIQVLNPQVNNEWRASVLMMETAKKSDRPLQEILDRKAALNGWQPWEEPEESAAPQSNAVQLAALLVDEQKRHGGEMTAEGFKKAMGTGGHADSQGFIDFGCKGISIRPLGESEWAKFIKFCKENGLIEEESIKCNHKPAQSAAAAATMAAPAVTPAAETSTTLESTADAAASTLKPSSPDVRTNLSAPASPADAGAAAQSLSAAAPASLEAQLLDSSAFDYTGLDVPTVDTLHWAEREIGDARRDYVARLAQAVYIVHDALCGGVVAICDNSKHGHRGEDTFRAWCASVGLGKDTAYRLLQVAALLNGSTPEEQAVLEAASPSLLYAAAKPSAPAQLVEGVKSGDITTHKKYQELLAQLKAKDQELADEKAAHQSESAAFSELFADEQRLRQQANEARIAAEKASLEAKESCRAAQDAAKAARQDAEAKAARIAELEARPVEVVGADPDEIERRANALAAEKTADLKVELSAEKARASQLEEQLEDVKEIAEQTSSAFVIGMARRLSDSCEEMLSRHFADLARVDYDTYEQATDLLRELGDKLSYAIENGGWPDQWPIEYEEGPDE